MVRRSQKHLPEWIGDELLDRSPGGFRKAFAATAEDRSSASLVGMVEFADERCAELRGAGSDPHGELEFCELLLEMATTALAERNLRPSGKPFATN